MGLVPIRGFRQRFVYLAPRCTTNRMLSVLSVTSGDYQESLSAINLPDRPSLMLSDGLELNFLNDLFIIWLSPALNAPDKLGFGFFLSSNSNTTHTLR